MKKSKFIKQQEKQSCLSWNYADWKAYNKLKKNKN